MAKYIPNSLKAKVIDFWNISTSFRDEVYTKGHYEVPEDESWLNKLLSGEIVPLTKPANSYPDVYVSCEETPDCYQLWVEKVVFPDITADSYDYADDIECIVEHEFATAAKLCTFLNRYTCWK